MNVAQLLEALSSKDYLVYSEAWNELEAWLDAHPEEARAHGLCALALASPSAGDCLGELRGVEVVAVGVVVPGDEGGTLGNKRALCSRYACQGFVAADGAKHGF